MVRAIPLLALAVAGCGTSGARADAADDATIDAAPDARALVVGRAFVPPTIRFDDAGFGPCDLDGTSVPYGGRVLVDNCVECQCTTYGLRCRKRVLDQERIELSCGSLVCDYSDLVGAPACE
jgi:hypothetical protein